MAVLLMAMLLNIAQNLEQWDLGGAHGALLLSHLPLSLSGMYAAQIQAKVKVSIRAAHL